MPKIVLFSMRHKLCNIFVLQLYAGEGLTIQKYGIPKNYHAALVN